jgi:hypothetical protein
VKLDAALIEELRAGKYAFIDAGCASGGSIDHCERRFGARPGLGLDWYGSDLELARQRGYTVAHCDMTTVELPEKCVAFASMMDFLEHLPDETAAQKVLENLAHASRDFLFIRHPSFEDIEYLAGFGLKLGWTDWKSHSNMMRIDDFRRLFDRLGWRDFLIYPDMPFFDSNAEPIVPLAAPQDLMSYDAALHGPKPFVEFDRPVYGQYNIFVRLNPMMAEEEWRRLVSIEGWRAQFDGTLRTHASASAAGGEAAPHESLDPLLSLYTRAHPEVSAVRRRTLRDLLLSVTGAGGEKLLSLVHLLNAFGRTEGVTRALALGEGAARSAAYLAARLPDLEVTVEEDGLAFSRSAAHPVRSGFDFVFAGDGLAPIHQADVGFVEALAAVRPGGWLYGEGQRGPAFAIDRLTRLCREQGCEIVLATKVRDRRLTEPLDGLLRILDAATTGSLLAELPRLALLDLEPLPDDWAAETRAVKVLVRRQAR